MDFVTGTDHPLATTPNIQLQFGGNVMNVYDAYYAHMEVAGDNIVVMISQARALPDYLFLVGWKTGKVSLVGHSLLLYATYEADSQSQILTAPDLTYAASFALIDTELILLVNLHTNALDVHRIVDSPSCAIQRVGTLSLPFSTTNISSLSASFRLAPASLTLYSSCPQCLPFYPSPDARLVGLTVITAAQDSTMTFYWLAIRTDYLCSMTETKRDSDVGGLGPTPWETWSHHTACCLQIEHPLAAPTPAGARWLLHSQPLVVREFGPSRPGRIDGDRRTHHEQVIDKAVLREALQDAFASQLPYCDITVSTGEKKYQSVIADYEWVVGMNNEVRSACASTLLYRRRSTLMLPRCTGRAKIFPERHIISISIMSYSSHAVFF